MERKEKAEGPRRARRVLLIVLAVAAFAAIYFAVDPSKSKWMPQCVFFHLTGWKCPGCGSQRMFHALLHGDMASAFSHNALMALLLPLLIPLSWLEIRRERHPRLYMKVCSLPVIVTLLAIVLTWGVLRNIFGI